MSNHSPEPWTSVCGSAEGRCIRLLRCRNSLLVALRCLFRHGRRAVPNSCSEVVLSFAPAGAQAQVGFGPLRPARA